MGFFREFTRARAERDSPAFAQRMAQQREYEFAQQQAKADNFQREKYLTGLMGNAPIPEQFEQQTQQMEGPLQPGQERGLMDVNQQVADAVPGSGYLGGDMGQDELAMRLMMAPSKGSRDVGGNILQGRTKPQTARAQTSIDYWKSDPEGFKAMQQATTRPSTKVTVNSGTEPEYKAGTPEQNVNYGYAADMPTHWEAKGGTMVLQPNIPETEASRKAKTYYTDMINAEDNLGILSETYPEFNPGEITESILREISGKGGFMGTVANVLQSKASRQYLAPMMSWVSANRAYLSGAAVPEVEFSRDIKTYFPSAADDPETVALKNAMREQRRQTLADSIGLSAEKRKRSLRRSANDDYRKLMKHERDSKAKSSQGGKPNPNRKFTAAQQRKFDAWKKSRGYTDD